MDAVDDMDDIQLLNRDCRIDEDEVILAVPHGGVDLSPLRDDWDFWVGDIRATPDKIFVDVEVAGPTDRLAAGANR